MVKKALKTANPSFEEGIQRLEEVVAALETPSVSLETSLELFSEGVHLVQYCQELLLRAEEKINVLVEKPDGALELQPFGE